MARLNRAVLIALFFAIFSVSAGCGRKGPPIVPRPDNALVFHAFTLSVVPSLPLK